jgi:hypothetical protein
MWYGKGKHIVRGQVCLVGCTALSLAGDGNGGSVRVGWTKKNMTPEKIVQWKIISTLIGVLGTHGFKVLKCGRLF